MARNRPRPAFSLVELLVAIGVVGLLLAITLPALRGARQAAARTAGMSDVAQCAKAIELFLDSNDQTYPVVLPDRSYQVNWRGSPIHFSTPDRWASAHMWTAVVRDVAPWEEFVGVFAGGDLPDEPGGVSHLRTPYLYSNSFVASPRLWTPEGAADAQANPDRYLAPVRAADVQFPAGKGMIFDIRTGAPAGRRASASERPRTPIAFADGHAALHALAEAAAPVSNPLNENPWRDDPIHNTPQGVHGRDY